MQEYELVIIGGGPAGLTAGLYASRYGINSLLIERGLFGGQIVNARSVDNYPGFPDGVSGMDLGQMMYDQAKKYGLKTENIAVNEFKFTDNGLKIMTDDNEISTRSVIVASGSNYNKLNIKGENRLLGRGVSYCATCDGFLFKNMDVAVIGGGDTAVTDALELSELVKEVYVIHRRDQLRSSEINQRQAFNKPNIKFIWDSIVEEIQGQEKVNSLQLKNVKTGDTPSLTVAGVFVAIGSSPNSELFKDILEIDNNGNIVTDQILRTSRTGIFAAGDIRKNSARQVATAVGDGARAAKSAFNYLRGQD